MSTPSFEKSKVFIVHGHDESAKNKVARFVEKLGFEAVILYTPDDVGNVKSDSENLKARARQNVVFEHGYLIGKLGRKNVAALVTGQLELPNDISGVVYIAFDTIDAWHMSLAKEMKQSGYDLDMNKLI